MRRVHKIIDPGPLQSKDESWRQLSILRPRVASSPGTSAPTLSPVMTMPIVVSVSSQSGVENHNLVEGPSSAHAKSVDRPSELTAGSPERIDDKLDLSAAGLVYMRKELNPDVGIDGTGHTVHQMWSVSDSSESTPEEGSQLLFLKKEVGEDESHNRGHPSMVSAGTPSTRSGNLNQYEEGMPLIPRMSHQQLEPTSTAGENDAQCPLDVYPVQYRQYASQNPAKNNDISQAHVEVNRVIGCSSPEGSYGRSADNATNPESPCRATSTRRSLDAQDALPGSHRCHFCDITFGDPVMHYLHMGWHVTGDPWKCNGCGQECVGKVDFFLHLYKAGHN